MVNFEPESVAIALTTHYPLWYRGKLRSIKHTEKIRGDLALETISYANAMGCNVVVSDAASSKSFRRELSKLTGIIINKKRVRKRSPGKRVAIRRASKIEAVKVIVITEPEKVSLIKDCLKEIVEPVLEGKVDVIIPSRHRDHFSKTYPPFQIESEQEGNYIYNEALRAYGLLKKDEEDLDMFFGPRVIANKKNVTALFMKKYRFDLLHFTIPLSADFFDLEQLSNTLFFPIVVALKKKLRVQSVEVPFQYPAIQRRNEESGNQVYFAEKRRLQRLSLVIELLHFISYLGHIRASRIRPIVQ